MPKDETTDQGPSGGDALAALGYQQQLERSVTTLGHISLILSDITPTASLLVIATAVIAIAGTASPIAFVVACFIAINIAFCMGELGSMFPVAGGLFSIVTRVLGRGAGFVAMIDYIGQAVFLPASVAIGIGTYVHSLAPSISERLISGIAMLVVTAVCLLHIRFNSWLTAVFLTIELLVITSVAVAGFTHWHQHWSILSHPVTLSNGHIGAIGASAVIIAIATSLFSVNGYDSGINFAEETLGSAKQVGRAVVTACLLGIVFELVPFVAVIFGAPSLSALLHSSTPVTYVAGAAFGSTFKTIITWGALLAIFNASVAITLQFSRIVWASGRDFAWPEPVSSWIGKVDSKRGAPWVATLIVGILASILCFQSTLVTVVTFTAVLLLVLYALIAISALVSRVSQRHLPRPSRMPWWPVPPIIALAGTGLALSQQKGSDLVVTGSIFAAALIYYFGFVIRRPGRYWIQANLPEPYNTYEPLPDEEPKQ
jgi:amino acid transporter